MRRAQTAEPPVSVQAARTAGRRRWAAPSSMNMSGIVAGFALGAIAVAEETVVLVVLLMVDIFTFSFLKIDFVS